MNNSATIDRPISSEWLPAMKFEGEDCIGCGKESEMSYNHDSYCLGCAKKMIGFVLGIEKPLAEDTQPNYEAVDYLSEFVGSADNEALIASISNYLNQNTAELIKNGDNWVVNKIANFLQDTQSTRDEPNAVFISPWFSLKPGDKNLAQKLQDTEQLIQILGYSQTSVEQADGINIVGYESDLLPTLQLARQENTQDNSVNYLVAKLPAVNVSFST